MTPLTKSKALNAALTSMGIITPMDVLRHLPRRYEDFSYSKPSLYYSDHERVVLCGKLAGPLPRPYRFAHKTLYRFSLETDHGFHYDIEAWNQTYLSKILNAEDTFTIVGYYDAKRGKISMSKIKKGMIPPEESFVPIYALPSEITQHVFRVLVKRMLLSYTGKMEEVVPTTYRKKYRLISLYDAYKNVHFPRNRQEVHQGLRVLKYQEALLFSLHNQWVRGANRALRKDSLRKIQPQMVERFIRTLPYPLTSDQRKAYEECAADMDSNHMMYRLLQGDVGTGKTLVAALCAYANHTRSEQTALLAPTDTLARQHYENLRSIFAGTNLQMGLLVGAMEPSEKRAIMADLADGTLDLVVGTHALFSPSVQYAYLGLAIIDEQHKFGVNQRSLLVDKGEHADLLMMSATPIPRTLTLTIYGDLDVSTLSQFPAGRRAVTTKIVPPKSPEIKQAIDRALATDHRVFVVVPQIEGNEKENTSVLKVAERYKKAYPNRVTMVHGKMDEESKQVATIAFQTGLCPILVATSLIEVGIDVKSADTMIVYSPTHFSLSSLHQLRGRIGRDGSPALFLMAYEKGEGDEEGEAKLKTLCQTDDGFAIAEADLKLRGPGEILGTKQSGLPSFQTLNVIDDFKIFTCARDDATEILRHPEDPMNKALISLVERLPKDGRFA